MAKILFLCRPGEEAFVKDVASHIAKSHQVKEVYSGNSGEIVQGIQWADIIWQEWADQLAIELTNHPFMLDNKQLILRLHSYEVLQGLVPYINWNRVDKLIFVAKHVYELGVQQILGKGKLEKNFDTFIIPNGVDLEKYKLTEDCTFMVPDEGVVLMPRKSKASGKNIAYIGTITHKKGPMLLLHAFYQLLKDKEEEDFSLMIPQGSSFHLHVAGEFVEPRFKYYWDHLVERMGLSKHITLHGRVDDMPEFLKEMHYVVCTSPWESQNMSVMEAMATGCKPLVHNFPGAEDIYAPEHLWNTIDEFSDMVRNDEWEPVSYRKFIEDRYALKDRMQDIDKVISEISEFSFDKGFKI